VLPGKDRGADPTTVEGTQIILNLLGGKTPAWPTNRSRNGSSSFHAPQFAHPEHAWLYGAYLSLTNYQQAREVFLKLLAKADQPQNQRAVYINNLAYAVALSENPAWLEEADAYSKDAYTILSWMPAVVGTRGTVLVALGKYEEGVPLLQKSMEDAYTPRSKADNACHIAIALARTGKPGEALKYLRLARDLDKKSPILARAEKVVQCSQQPEALAMGAG